MHFYLAERLREPADGDEAAHPDEDEDIEVQAFSRDEISRMIAAGEVVDLKTVAGLWLIQHRV
jgi:hypothetical protein